jgi:hypothetical protein
LANSPESTNTVIKELKMMQNQRLLTVLGACQPNQVALITKETGVEPLFVSARTVTLEHALNSKDTEFTRKRHRVAGYILIANLPRSTKQWRTGAPEMRLELPIENLPSKVETAQRVEERVLRKWNAFKFVKQQMRATSAPMSASRCWPRRRRRCPLSRRD